MANSDAREAQTEIERLRTLAKKAIERELPEDEHDYIPDWCYDTIIAAIRANPAPKTDAAREALGPLVAEAIASITDPFLTPRSAQFDEEISNRTREAFNTLIAEAHAQGLAEGQARIAALEVEIERLKKQTTEFVFNMEPCVTCGEPEKDHGDHGFRDHAYMPPHDYEPVEGDYKVCQFCNAEPEDHPRAWIKESSNGRL